MQLIRGLCHAAALLAAPVALAQAPAPIEPPIRIQDYSSEYVLNQDGSFVETRGWSMQVLKEQAVAGAKQTSISYSTSIQQAEVLQAYTLKQGGQHIDAPKTNFQVTVNGGKDKDAPVFSDMTTMTVVFPEVAVGDTVVFSYRLKATEPLFANQFSVWETFPRAQATAHIKVRVDAPVGMAINHQAIDMTESARIEKDGRAITEWTRENPSGVKSNRKNYSAVSPESEPGIFISTFRSYGEIAAAYGQRANAMAAVTPRVQKLADEIAANKTTPREKTKALYEWVATNISYAGNCIGLGAVVPHDLNFVLDNRMGDCKDHATLLQSLLSAKGIPSTQALINANNIYVLPKLPVASLVNHVINYVPDLDLYLDSTATDTPFGMLPMLEEGKPTLLVNGFAAGTKVPMSPLGSNEQRMKTVIKVKPDGSFQGDVKVELKGQFAIVARAGMKEVSPEIAKDVVSNFYKQTGYLATGMFSKDERAELSSTYHYAATFDVMKVLSLPGNGAFPIGPLIFSNSPIARFVAGAIQDGDEINDTACWSGRSIEEYVFEFPASMKIVSIPENLELKNEFLTYRATYARKGNSLIVKRDFDDRTVAGVCKPDVSAAYKSFALRVMPNLKAQVIYK